MTSWPRQRAAPYSAAQRARTKSGVYMYGTVEWRMALLPVFPLQRPTSFLPQSRSSQIGQCYVAIFNNNYKTNFVRFSNCAGRTPNLDNMMSCTLYRSVQEPTWEKLVEASCWSKEEIRRYNEPVTIIFWVLSFINFCKLVSMLLHVTCHTLISTSVLT